MDVLVVMDRLEDADPDGDTSIGLMAAAFERGHRVRHCTPADLSLSTGEVRARTRDVIGGAEVRFARGGQESIELSEVDAVFVRPDPPVNADYLAMTLVLEFARGQTLIINDPRALREANEKLYACRFPELMPATVVTADATVIMDAAAEWGAAVLKPLDGHGGRGVCLVEPGSPDATGLIKDRTADGTRLVMAQQYLPVVREGDRRILLLDGAPLGVLRRRPADGEFRANIGLGGTVDVVELNHGDRRIIERLAPALRTDGLWFVGIDVIDGHLSEVNVTSPTGLRQLTRLSGTRPDLAVIDWVEERARTLPG